MRTGPIDRFAEQRARRRRRRRARRTATTAGPFDRLAEQRARRRRRQRVRKRRAALDRSNFEVARLQRQRKRAAKRNARRIQRQRRRAAREARPRWWRDRPGAPKRAEARLRRAARRDELRQKFPQLTWYRGLPEQTALPRWEIVTLGIVALAAGIGVATSSKDPTGAPLIDLGWSLVVGTAVALAGTRAPRRVLLACGAVAALGVESWWALAGVGAMAMASGLVYRQRGVIVGLRVLHAASAGLTLVALVRIPPLRFAPPGPGWTVASLGVAAIGIVVILVSGWWNSPRSVRTATAIVAAAGASLVILLTGSLWLVLRNNQLDADVALVAEGTTHSTSDLAASLADLEAAGPSLEQIDRRLSWPVWLPLRAVPLAAQQLTALDATVDTARDLVARAGDGAAVVNSPALRPEPGRVDVAALTALEEPLARTVASLEAADERLNSIGSSLLLPGIATLVDDIQTAAADALPPTELALSGTQAVASMLGAQDPKTWLVQYVGAGGTQAQLAVADNGVITPLDLFVFLDPALATSIGDLSTSPDYPTAAAEAAAQIANAGLRVDGIITVDPIGASAIASAFGASEAAGNPAALVAALGAAAVPSPSKLAEAVGTAAAERRVLVWSIDPEDQTFLESIDVAGSLQRNDGTVDFVYVGLTPSGSVSADQLGRTITYRTNYDAGTGESSSRGELRISNPTGVQLDAELTLITGFELESLEVLGIQARPTESELSGWNRWTLDIALPATGDLVVTWSVRGTMPTFAYTFGFTPQPLGGATALTWDFVWTYVGSIGAPTRLVNEQQALGPITFRPIF